ncbi:MAG: substrate-binding domain-containing protein, partial [Anaerolineae bacterium]
MSKSKRKMTGKRDTRPTIALLTDQVVYEYQSEIVTGVIEAARERDVNLLCFIGGRLGVTDGFESQGNAIYDLVRAESVDGVVVMASALSSQVGFEEIKSLCESFHPLPMVSVGLMLEGVTSLVVDNKTGLHEVLVHLIKDHGYRRIAFIRGPEASAEAVLRYHTYLNVLKEFDLPFDPDLVVPGDFLRPSGVAAVSLLLDERGVDFDAIVAANDGMALGALETLQVRGIRVPDDIAVVGFDDVEETEFVTPPLTTVRQALYKQGQQATEMVLALMAGEKVPEQVTLSTEMVIRQSCGCLPAVVLEVKSEQVAKQKRQAIESAVQAHRDSILSGMMQAAAISSVELTSEQAEQLLTAFAGELSGKASGVFLPTLNSIINRAVAAGSDVGAWQTVLSALRLLSSHLDEDSLSQAESLWLRARVLIGETARRVQGHRALQEAVRNRTLWQVGAALITTLDLEHSMDVLADGLPHVGIPSAYLSLYQDPQPYAYPQPVPEWSRLVLTYEKMGDSVGSKQVKLSVEGQRFPTHRLVPKELLPQDRQYCLVVRPLFLHESQIGFVLFEAGSQELATCEMLSTLISSALYGALLAQQTRDYAVRVQTAAEVSQAASSILDPIELIQQVVELVQERFALYYAGLFMVEEADSTGDSGGKWAVLQAGTGEAGRQMLARGHRLEIGGGSMIGWCVANKQARIALDVGEDAVRFENPFLPETRSELALPLVSRGEAIGALTIQSTEESAFSEEDVAVLQTMADRLANAIANARLYSALTREQYLMKALMENVPDYIYFKDTKSRFIVTTAAHLKTFGLSDLAGLVGKSDFDFFSGEHAQQAYDDEQRIIETGEPILGVEERETWPDRPDTWVLTSKMPLRDEAGNIVGTFGISRDITPLKLAEMALERRALQLQTAAEVSHAVSSILDPDDLIRQVVNLVQERFNLYYAGLFLVDQVGEWAVLQAGTGEAGRQMLAR